jgi:hypothetical protein
VKLLIYPRCLVMEWSCNAPSSAALLRWHDASMVEYTRHTSTKTIPRPSSHPAGAPRVRRAHWQSEWWCSWTRRLLPTPGRSIRCNEECRTSPGAGSHGDHPCTHMRRCGRRLGRHASLGAHVSCECDVQHVMFHTIDTFAG